MLVNLCYFLQGMGVRKVSGIGQQVTFKGIGNDAIR